MSHQFYNKNHDLLIKEEETIQFLQHLHEKENISNFVHLFKQFVFYNHEKFNGRNITNYTSNRTTTTTTNNTNSINVNDIKFLHVVQKNGPRYSTYTSNKSKVHSLLKEEEQKEDTSETYTLSFYENTITIKLYVNFGINRCNDIRLKFKYTTLENFLKCKLIFIEILKLYNRLYSYDDDIVVIINSVRKYDPIEKRTHKDDSIKSIDYFLNSLEEIFMYYKDTTFDMYKNTIMDIKISIVPSEESIKRFSSIPDESEYNIIYTSTTSNQCTTSKESLKNFFSVDYSFYVCCEFLRYNKYKPPVREYVPLFIEDYRNMCESIKKHKIYERFANNYMDFRITPSNEKDIVIYNINSTKGGDDVTGNTPPISNEDNSYFDKEYFELTPEFKDILCEGESTVKFKTLKPVQ